jgi:hypothetical protein
MSAPTKAAVRKADWDRFKLDGGALVVYPPRKGGELAGMVPIWISDAPPASVTVRPIPLAPRGGGGVRKLEKAHG